MHHVPIFAPPFRWRLALPLLGLLVLSCGCGSRSLAASKTHPRQVAVVHKHPYSRQNHPRASLPARRVNTTGKRHRQKRVLPESRYARHLIPILTLSIPAFDRAASNAAAGGLDGMMEICSTSLDQINILAAEFDGVPHPYAWYQPVGKMHHNLAGIYHDMLGALQLCQTASSNGDGDSASSAVEDMRNAAGRLRGFAAFTQWQAHRT